jgi:polysaccharide biosynthesis/export protein
MRVTDFNAYFLLVSVTIASCAGQHRSQGNGGFLHDDKSHNGDSIVRYREVTIAKGDVLGVEVFNINREASAAFNMSVSNASEVNAGLQGFSVDQNGDVYLPHVGLISVCGLTKSQCEKHVTEKLKLYFTDPHVRVQFINCKITIIGEVNHQGVFNLSSERISVLELMGLAGDLTLYGRRDNILVIRENSEKREFGHIDLQKPDLFQSPFYYLHRNDVVVVSASSKKPTVGSETTFKKLSLITGFTSLVSAAAILFNLFR